MASKATPLWTVLLLFVLVLITVVMTGLYLDLRHKFSALEEKNRELADSQVLLMVPDDQAEALARWLETHPNETQRLLQRVETKANSADEKPAGEELPVSPKSNDNQASEIPEALVPEVISENEDGVKVIVLPHGGIRVTTREEKH